MSGRKKDAIWVHFEEIRDGKSKRAKCKACKKYVVALVARMRAHKERKCGPLPSHKPNNSFLWDFPSGYRMSEDSMPLQQRMLLSPPQVQIPSSESLLQSQPLSPTKLKVTRQSTKQSSFTPKVETPTVIPAEEVCLRWNSHHSNMQTSFPQLLEKEQFVDVTLVAEEKTLKCHRIILSSCSAYFEEILNGITPLQHPVVILKGIPFWILKALTDFMYVGEVNIDQNKLPELLDVAELLKVKGLAGKSNSSDNRKSESQPAKKMPVKDAVPRHPAAKNPPQAVPVVAKVEEMPISDPLELLEPRFHDDSDGSSSRTKENRLSSRRILSRKIRKRKPSEDEPAPPLFPMRRGTRSRPNVKIPKYYDYEDIVKPCASDAQPLSPLVTIKSEPLDVEENDVYTESGESSLNTSTETENVRPKSSTNSKPPEELRRTSESPPMKNKSVTKEKQQVPLMYKIKIKSFSSLSEKSNCKPAGDGGGGEENANSAGKKEADPVDSSDSAAACDILNDSEVQSPVVESNVAVDSNDCNAQDGTNGNEASVSEKETVDVDTSQTEQAEELLNTSEQHTADSTGKIEVEN